MNVASPILLTLAAVLVVAIVLVATRRRIEMPRMTKFLILLGAVMLALACGDLQLDRPQTRDVLVMVDLSPSTRGASFRDIGLRKTRIDQLLGLTPYRIHEFSSALADKTDFEPPPSDAILLFSDAQFELPQVKSPTYIVVDPVLDQPADASVVDIQSTDGQATATVRNAGGPRELRWRGAQSETKTVNAGNQVVTAKLDGSNPSIISARLAAQDAWTENDSLMLYLPPPAQMQRWWVGTAPPPSDAWRVMQPSELPIDSSAYLSVSAIALANVSADAIPPSLQQRVLQYVRDLGGGVVIVGGDQAFAAGAYDGSAIDTLSPLSSSPPAPQRHWMILVDSSGSMAATIPEGGTRWLRAASAATQLLPRLPPADVVSIGDFARSLRWWSQSRLVGATAKLPLSPAGISPQGPTNLQVVLIAIGANYAAPTDAEIIVLSDGQAPIDNVEQVAEQLKQKRIRVHLVATAEVNNSAVAKLVELTGGSVTTQPDPKLWVAALRSASRSAMPDSVQRSTLTINFLTDLSSLTSRPLQLWNRAWLKREATELAQAETNGVQTPLAAHWRLGAGRAVAIAFEANPAEIEAITQLVARPPRDPRFKVSWRPGATLRVSVDAVDQDTFLNDLDLRLSVSDESNPAHILRELRLPQTGPGRYEMTIASPSSPSVISIRTADRPIDRFAVPGRYPAEFEQIGNNRESMKRLAASSGGEVIEPNRKTPIDFKWPRNVLSLRPFLATLGAMFIALGLIKWKRAAA